MLREQRAAGPRSSRGCRSDAKFVRRQRTERVPCRGRTQSRKRATSRFYAPASVGFDLHFPRAPAVALDHPVAGSCRYARPARAAVHALHSERPGLAPPVRQRPENHAGYLGFIWFGFYSTGRHPLRRASMENYTRGRRPGRFDHPGARRRRRRITSGSDRKRGWSVSAQPPTLQQPAVAVRLAGRLAIALVHARSGATASSPRADGSVW